MPESVMQGAGLVSSAHAAAAEKTTTAKAKKKATKPKAAAKSTKPAKARSKSVNRKHSRLDPARPAAARATQYSQKYAALVVNADTGEVLYDNSAGELRHPASLTKMMTLYLLFDALKKDQVKFDTLLPVSEKAASQPQTNISLTPGDRITVKLAIESLIIRSANDSAMVVAEALGGSQSGFADLMNVKCKQLGMKDTVFYNPNGLPDERQVTTAFDMARLGIALRRDFPEYYHFFSQREFDFRGRVYEGHNRLLGRYQGADGIKTGYIRLSGFNLVTSAKRGGYRLVGVVLGGRTAATRDQQMMDMLDDTFAQLLRTGGRQSSETRPEMQGQMARYN